MASAASSESDPSAFELDHPDMEDKLLKTLEVIDGDVHSEVLPDILEDLAYDRWLEFFDQYNLVPGSSDSTQKHYDIYWQSMLSLEQNMEMSKTLDRNINHGKGLALHRPNWATLISRVERRLHLYSFTLARERSFEGQAPLHQPGYMSAQARFKLDRPDENQRAVNRISYLGGLLLPVGIVSAILSMNDDFLPSGPHFYVFWAASVPLALLAMVIIYADTIRTAEVWFESGSDGTSVPSAAEFDEGETVRYELSPEPWWMSVVWIRKWVVRMRSRADRTGARSGELKKTTSWWRIIWPWGRKLVKAQIGDEEALSGSSPEEHEQPDTEPEFYVLKLGWLNNNHVARRQSEGDARHKLKGPEDTPRPWSWPATGTGDIDLPPNIEDERRVMEESNGNAAKYRQSSVPKTELGTGHQGGRRRPAAKFRDPAMYMGTPPANDDFDMSSFKDSPANDFPVIPGEYQRNPRLQHLTSVYVAPIHRESKLEKAKGDEASFGSRFRESEAGRTGVRDRTRGPQQLGWTGAVKVMLGVYRPRADGAGYVAHQRPRCEKKSTLDMEDRGYGLYDDEI